jgi:hypothetical protein
MVQIRNYESGGRGFESLPARQLNQSLTASFCFDESAGLQTVCKLCSLGVLEFKDRLFGKRSRSGKIFVEDLPDIF